MNAVRNVLLAGAMVLCSFGCASTTPPPPATPVVTSAPMPKYAQLAKASESIQKAREHLRAAEEAHAQHGGLGGHAKQAIQSLDAAKSEIDQAVSFAQGNTTPGQPGQITPRPELTSRPDDAKYPNLGEARLEVERAIRHLEEAEEFHHPIGTLGGHGGRSVDACHEALHEINEAEHFADSHM